MDVKQENQTATNGDDKNPRVARLNRRILDFQTALKSAREYETKLQSKLVRRQRHIDLLFFKLQKSNRQNHHLEQCMKEQEIAKDQIIVDLQQKLLKATNNEFPSAAKSAPDSLTPQLEPNMAEERMQILDVDQNTLDVEYPSFDGPSVSTNNQNELAASPTRKHASHNERDHVLDQHLMQKPATIVRGLKRFDLINELKELIKQAEVNSMTGEGEVIKLKEDLADASKRILQLRNTVDELEGIFGGQGTLSIR